MVDIVGAVNMMRQPGPINMLSQAEVLRAQRNRNALAPLQQTALQQQNEMVSREMRRDIDLQNALASGDLNAIAALDPTQARSRQQFDQVELQQTARELLPLIAQARQSKNPRMFARFAATSQNTNLPDRMRKAIAQVDFDSMTDEEFMQELGLLESQLMSVAGMQRTRPAPIKLGADDRLFDPATGDMLVEAAPGAQDLISGDDKTLIGQRKDARAVARNLQSDIGTRDIVRNYNLLRNSLKEGTAASDTAAIIAVAKIMDPNSVVREGEVYIWNRSDGVFGFLESQLRNLTSTKGAKLSSSNRRELATIATNVIDSAETEWNRDVQGMRDGFRVLDQFDPQFLDSTFASPFSGLERNIEVAGDADDQKSFTGSQGTPYSVRMVGD